VVVPSRGSRVPAAPNTRRRACSLRRRHLRASSPQRHAQPELPWNAAGLPGGYFPAGDKRPRRPKSGGAAQAPPPARKPHADTAYVTGARAGPVCRRTRARPCAPRRAGSGTPPTTLVAPSSLSDSHLLVVGGLRGVRSGVRQRRPQCGRRVLHQPGRARSWICPGQTRAGRGARWTADCLVRRWRRPPPTRA